LLSQTIKKTGASISNGNPNKRVTVLGYISSNMSLFQRTLLRSANMPALAPKGGTPML